MRHHTLPKHAIRKDRDYILFEKGAFTLSLATALCAWATMFPMDLQTQIKQLAMALSTRDFKELPRLLEEARKTAWAHNKKPSQHQADGLLMLLDALSEPIIAAAKNPDPVWTKEAST
jgi:hypothetical protein